ncbi:hypothetical protein PRIPAC_96195 [Pristionchus pacificus]|uniref:Uncharacterized protein n=1 Tax=Pristionchus pacificus TaxID=54126 RepID=A0A2A6B2X8_PRIPA|nr:hypothetical protein PRIPAC_96195 [Pristionchus pacificus]|eukprot:PDM60237.1 hypothetical protein PRIPAC_54062 [Pristionchus pacificus]
MRFATILFATCAAATGFGQGTLVIRRGREINALDLQGAVMAAVCPSPKTSTEFGGKDGAFAGDMGGLPPIVAPSGSNGRNEIGGGNGFTNPFSGFGGPNGNYYSGFGGPNGNYHSGFGGPNGNYHSGFGGPNGNSNTGLVNVINTLPGV